MFNIPSLLEENENDEINLIRPLKKKNRESNTSLVEDETKPKSQMQGVYIQNDDLCGNFIFITSKHCENRSFEYYCSKCNDFYCSICFDSEHKSVSRKKH